jgi:hypothetical protein
MSKELQEILDKWQKGELDQETVVKIVNQHLQGTQRQKEERKKARRRKLGNLVFATFNVLILAGTVFGFVYLNVKTANSYVGLSAVEMFWKKSFERVCNYRRCINPGTHKKVYHIYGIGVGKGTAHYYCDEHIKVAPKSLGTYTPFLAKMLFVISLIGLGGVYIVILLKAFGAAVEREEFIGNLALLILVSGGLYLVPTATTFLM